MSKFEITSVLGGMKKGKNILRVQQADFKEDDLILPQSYKKSGFLKPRIYTEELRLLSDNGDKMASIRLNQLMPKYSKVVDCELISETDTQISITKNLINIVSLDGYPIEITLTIATNHASLLMAGNIRDYCGSINVNLRKYVDPKTTTSSEEFRINSNGELLNLNVGRVNLVPYITSQSFICEVGNNMEGWVDTISLIYTIKLDASRMTDVQTFTFGPATIRVSSSVESLSLTTIDKTGSIYIDGSKDINFNLIGGMPDAAGSFISEEDFPIQEDQRCCPGYTDDGDIDNPFE